MSGRKPSPGPGGPRTVSSRVELAGARWPLALHVAQVAGYRLPLHIPWVAIGVALAASVLIGAVASVLPARRAASIRVLEAITYE